MLTHMKRQDSNQLKQDTLDITLAVLTTYTLTDRQEGKRGNHIVATTKFTTIVTLSKCQTFVLAA